MHIFGLYGRSLQQVQKHPRDWSRAKITYSEKDDALYAYDHLNPLAKANDKHSSVTEIDGKVITVSILDQ